MLRDSLKEAKFNYVLSKNVEVGQKIKLNGKWNIIKVVDKNGIILDNGNRVEYGEPITAWKK